MAEWPYGTAQWRRLRMAKLYDCPTCEACMRRGVIVGADAVDHIVAIAAGGAPFPSTDGLMSLCWSCHSSKTGRVDRGGKSHKRGLKGCDVHGNPLDPEGWEQVPNSSPTEGGKSQTAQAGCLGEFWF
ncbi:HNH endonuclease [Sinorhizobium medicae]|nr:HNH endonuclease [Sinorhizobium medicae]MDX0728181.1 HNH endonuclease [Sinorhizobium medicae]MDX0734437.1 HNH endonuclease [Sinorhizobium medicae]MDX0814704.1 HNH endonuclease [Sinorhizobium medicae]